MSNVEINVHEGWEKELDLSEALDSLGADIKAEAQRLAPVDTGALRDSLDHEVADDANPTGKALYVFSDLDYSVYQEMGTSNVPPHPYLRPALEKKRRL